jgi:virginiamycin B lyase
MRAPSVKLFCLLGSLAFSATVVAQRPANDEFPEGPGKALVQNHCSTCHSLTTISRSAGYASAMEWRRVFSTMVHLPDSQADTVAAYLSEHFPEDVSPAGS